jgi:dihydrofolate reductase
VPDTELSSVTFRRAGVYIAESPVRGITKGFTVRKLILRMLVSTDAYIADLKGDLRFGPHWSERLQKSYAETFSAAGGLVFGRTVFGKYVPYWEGVAVSGRHPNSPATAAEVAYATQVRKLPKFVASRTLPEAGNATVLREDVAASIAALKAERGGDLLLMCGPELVASLTAANLIDEYLLDVYPVVLGRGIQLWRDLPEPLELELVGEDLYPGQVAMRRYVPKP